MQTTVYGEVFVRIIVEYGEVFVQTTVTYDEVTANYNKVW